MRSQDKGCPVPRHTYWDLVPPRAFQIAGCRRVGGHLLVSGIWEKSLCLWPRSNFLQTRTQDLETLHPFLLPPTKPVFPVELHVGPAYPMAQAPLAKMDASSITEGPRHLLF